MREAMNFHFFFFLKIPSLVDNKKIFPKEVRGHANEGIIREEQSLAALVVIETFIFPFTFLLT